MLMIKTLEVERLAPLVDFATQLPGLDGPEVLAQGVATDSFNCNSNMDTRFQCCNTTHGGGCGTQGHCKTDISTSTCCQY